MTKNSKAKRLLAVLLAVVMILGLGTVAMAVQHIPGAPGTSAPPINPTRSASLTIHHHGYADTPHDPPPFGSPAGPGFPGASDTDAPVTAEWNLVQLNQAQIDTLMAALPVGSSAWQTAVRALVPGGFQENATNQTAVGAGTGLTQTTNATTGATTFGNLAQGIYIAWPTFGSAQPFIVHLPIWHYSYVDCGECEDCDDGEDCEEQVLRGGWLYDVHVYVKEEPPQEPDVDKLVEMAEGNFIRWAIEIEIMEDIGTLRPILPRPLMVACGDCPACDDDETCTSLIPNPNDPVFTPGTATSPHIRVIDVLDPRLSLTSPADDAVRVYFWNVEDDEYAVLPSNMWVRTTTTLPDGSTAIVVDILAAGRDHIAAHGVYVCLEDSDPLDYCDDYPDCPRDMGNIRVVIDTELDLTDTDRFDPDDGPIRNVAQVFYGDQPPRNPHDDMEHFHLDLRKVDVRGEPLAGAVFHLFTEWQINPATGVRWGLTPGNQTSTWVTTYSAADLAAAQAAFRATAPAAVIAAAYPAVLPTTLAPVATINMTTGSTFFTATGRSLVQGLTEGTYFLYEFTAPNGFNRIRTAQQVEVDMVHARSDDPDDVNDYRIVEVRVTNSSDFDLPLAGGAGQLLFTVVGLLLIGGSAIILIASKKRKQR